MQHYAIYFLYLVMITYLFLSILSRYCKCIAIRLSLLQHPYIWKDYYTVAQQFAGKYLVHVAYKLQGAIAAAVVASRYNRLHNFCCNRRDNRTVFSYMQDHAMSVVKKRLLVWGAYTARLFHPCNCRRRLYVPYNTTSQIRWFSSDIARYINLLTYLLTYHPCR